MNEQATTTIKEPKTFNNWQFKRLRQFLGLTQQALAAKLGCPYSIIGMLECNRRGVPLSIKEHFYNVYGLRYDIAIQYETKEELLNAISGAQDFQGDRADVLTNIVSIPLYEISAAAGEGTILTDEPAQSSLLFDRRVLKQMVKTDNYEALHLIYAKGDSMDSGWNQPDDIKDGDLLMIDTSKTTGNNSDFVILVNNTDLRVKRLSKQGDSLCISSRNPKYKPEFYYPDNPNFELKIIGKVVLRGCQITA